MDKNERRALYRKAIEMWGVPAQVMMVVEEVGEMLNALAKFNRDRSTPQEIITELVDVWILMEQMAVVFGVEQFEKEKEYKLQRLKERLEKNYKLTKENK